MRKVVVWGISLLVLVLTSCSSQSKITHKGRYAIAFDSSFYPAHIQGVSAQVVGFTRDLFIAISKNRGIDFEAIETGSGDIMAGLQQKDFDAIVTSINLVGEQRNLYRVSNDYLYTGPVLIVAMYSMIASAADLKHKLVGIEAFSSEAQVIEKYPLMILKRYSSESLALEALLLGDVNAVIMNALDAYQYCHHAFQGQIRIISHPLSKDGLHLMTLKNGSDFIIDEFNKGLKEIQNKGIYHHLLEKWSLTSCH